MEGEEDDEDDAEVPEEDEDGEGEDEEAAQGEKIGGPAAAAKKAKGGVVPKEDNLSEVEDVED